MKGEHIVRGPGGGLPGAGRPPKSLQLKNYEKVLKILDKNAEKALMVLVNGLEAVNENGDPDKWMRYQCAVAILKKVLPDKKSKEVTGKNGNPIEVNVVDRREAVLNIVNILDNMDLKDVKEKAKDEDFRLLESTRRRDIEAEAQVYRDEEAIGERD